MEHVNVIQYNLPRSYNSFILDHVGHLIISFFLFYFKIPADVKNNVSSSPVNYWIVMNIFLR